MIKVLYIVKNFPFITKCARKLSSGEYQALSNYCNKRLISKPHDFVAKRFLAYSEFYKGNYDDSLGYFKEVLINNASVKTQQFFLTNYIAKEWKQDNYDIVLELCRFLKEYTRYRIIKIELEKYIIASQFKNGNLTKVIEICEDFFRCFPNEQGPKDFVLKYYKAAKAVRKDGGFS